MAKALWIAGMLLGTTTAVSTVMPHSDAVGRWSRNCIETAMADVSTCINGPTMDATPVAFDLNEVVFSPDMPTASQPDTI